MLDYTHAEKIRRLNDCFRRSFVGGQILLTQGVTALGPVLRDQLLRKVREFDTFDNRNDPHREHDFGAIDFAHTRYFWKIDYYDLAGEMASPDPANARQTRRVMTVMRADEY